MPALCNQNNGVKARNHQQPQQSPKQRRPLVLSVVVIIRIGQQQQQQSKGINAKQHETRQERTSETCSRNPERQRERDFLDFFLLSTIQFKPIQSNSIHTTLSCAPTRIALHFVAWRRLTTFRSEQAQSSRATFHWTESN